MKSLIIGLDGGTWSILRPLVDSGHLPNLRNIIENSSTASLQSTIPPVTALAWPTFFTGLNPGRHGLLGWQQPLTADFRRPWISGNNIRGTKLWHILNNAGMSVGVVNVPVTYPPEPLNGWMISGLLTPNLKSQFTYPDALKFELLTHVQGYQIDIDVQRSSPKISDQSAMLHFVQKAQQVTKVRGDAIRWLIEAKNPTVVIAVFEMPDRLQHIVWKDVVDASTGCVKTHLQREILNAFTVLDNEIGKLSRLLEKNGVLCIISDHGFGPISQIVFMNDWLEQHGWLQYQADRLKWWNAARFVGSKIKYILPSRILWRARRSLPIYQTFDWKHTIAYSGLPTEHGIFINLVGREPMGTVSPQDYEHVRTNIINTLQQWKDPDTGTTIFPTVHRKEDIYQGPYVFDAPDIVFEIASGYDVSDMRGRNKAVLIEDAEYTGWGKHERDGIFVLQAPGVLSGYKAALNPHLVDILPTLLYLLRIPVPGNLDGEVLTSLFSPEYLEQYPPEYADPVNSSSDNDPESPLYTPDDALLIEERLRGLGYL